VRKATRGRRGGVSSILTSVAAIVFAAAVWETLWRLHVFAYYDLPAPRAVAHTWWVLSRRGILWHDLRVTIEEAGLGFLLAFGVAAIVGYPLAKFRLVSTILSPYIAGTQAMPMLALAPLLVVWFGLGLFSKTLICAVIVFFPMLVNIAVGIRTVDRTLIEAASTEGAGWWQTLRRVELPLAMRTILAGVRMALTLSMTGAIVAEFIASSSGLGYLMLLARSEYDAPLLFAAAITMIGLAVAGYLLVMVLEYALVDWD
jgi:NitT/TauT family transport system permease protein